MTEKVEEEVTSEATESNTIDPVAALTEDLQRLQAEYSNYKKRVDRDRALAGDYAVSGVLSDLLPILDDLDRAS
ncbi:MAG: nucleotide exchange factor GrpE, partial [Actinobacteria bacterium]|nr:nucleotide exchange factor GrpE [Actinomycetota bacterium]